MRLTPAIARAAGRDAANKAMREAGRRAWSAADYDLAADTYERLARIGGFWVDDFSNDDDALDILLGRGVPMLTNSENRL
jgi:hypothetical protein